MRTSKSIRNNTMKKMLLATALALLITGCAQQTFTVAKQTGSSTKETITHHFFVSTDWAGKLSMSAKICGGARKSLLKCRNPANIRKWIARFYYFRHLYSAGSVCIAHNNCMSCPSCKRLYLLINILLGSFQLFLHSSQPL